MEFSLSLMEMWLLIGMGISFMLFVLPKVYANWKTRKQEQVKAELLDAEEITESRSSGPNHNKKK